MQYIQFQPQDPVDIITPGDGHVNVFLDSETNTLLGKDENGDNISLVPAPSLSVVASDFIPYEFLNKQKNFVWENTFSFDKYIIDGAGEIYLVSPIYSYVPQRISSNSIFSIYSDIASKMNYPNATSQRGYSDIGHFFSEINNDLVSIFGSYPGAEYTGGQTYFLPVDASGEVKSVVNFLIDVLRTAAKYYDNSLTYTTPIPFNELPALVSFQTNYSYLFNSGGIFETGLYNGRFSRLLLVFADYLTNYRNEQNAIITDMGPSYVNPNGGDNSISLSNFQNVISFFSNNFG